MPQGTASARSHLCIARAGFSLPPCLAEPSACVSHPWFQCESFFCLGSAVADEERYPGRCREQGAHPNHRGFDGVQETSGKSLQGSVVRDGLRHPQQLVPNPDMMLLKAWRVRLSLAAGI